MKKIIIIIIAFLLSVVIFIALSLLSTLKGTPKEVVQPKSTPTQQQGPVQSKSVFNGQNFKNFEGIVKNRPTPFPQDGQIRETLIQSLGGNTGILIQDKDIQISYLKSANDFEVEILTNDIVSAQQRAIDFFTSKGLSEDGICKLPLFFFASSTVLQHLNDTGQTLNATPTFCQ